MDRRHNKMRQEMDIDKYIYKDKRQGDKLTYRKTGTEILT